MKRVTLPLVAAIIMSASGVMYAASPAVTTPTTAKSTVPSPSATATNTTKTVTTKQTTTNNTVNLYAAPDAKSNVVGSVNINQQLVSIFQKDGWVKVGNPEDGTVGWINKDQYQQAVKKAFTQNFQTLYVQQTQENGKAPQIVVYQNGQKLTGEQAKAVVANMQKQQEQMQKSMWLMQQHINAWMNQPMMNFPMMPMPQPVIIIENQGGTNTNNTK